MAVWAHDPEQLADDWVPYEWDDDGESRTVRRRPRVKALKTGWPIQAPAECAGGICGRCQRCRQRKERERDGEQ